MTELIQFLSHRDQVREIERQNISVIYGQLREAQKYIWPTFTMICKDGSVKTKRMQSSIYLQSELMVASSSPSINPSYPGPPCFDYTGDSNNFTNFMRAWKDCSKPKDGAQKLLLNQWEEDDGFKVKWLNTITVCTVCLRTIKLNECSEQADDIHHQLQHDPDIARTQSLYEKLKPELKDRYWYYGIHADCNPRKKDTIKRLSYCLKTDRDNRYLIKAGLGKANPYVGFLKTLSDCWPSFAEIHKGRAINRITKEEKERLIRKWATRNPGKASTESARSFFKLVFGISNLTKYTNDINTKQNRQNLRTAKSRNPMLARSR